MLDRILDSLSEAPMHKIPLSRVRRASCPSLAALLPSTAPPPSPGAPIGGSPWDLEVFRCGIHLTPTTSSLMQFGYLDTRGVNPKRKSCGRNNGQGKRLAFVAHVRLKLFCATCKLRGLGTPYAAPSNRRAGTASCAFSLGCDLRCAL